MDKNPVVGSVIIEEDTKTTWIYTGKEWIRVDKDPLLYAFEHFYYMDKANACMHCSPVKFSPITFRLANVLFEGHNLGRIDMTPELEEVKSHVDKYELDPGR